MRYSFLNLPTVFMVTASLVLAVTTVPEADAQVTFGAITGTLRGGVLADFALPALADCDRPISGPGPHTVTCSAAGAQVDFTVVVTHSSGPAGGSVDMNGGGSVQVPADPTPHDSVFAFGAYIIDVAFTLSVPVTVGIGIGGSVTDSDGRQVVRPGEAQVLGAGSYVLQGSGGIQNSTIPNSLLGNGRFRAGFSVVGFDPPREFIWAGPPGGTYSDPTNWDPEENAPPTHDGLSGDTVIFETLFDDDSNEITAYAVSAIGATAERFIIDLISLNLIGTAQVFEPSSIAPSLTIINGGRLILENGARFFGVHGSVGFNSAFQSQLAGLEIIGNTSECSFSGRLIIGEFHDGELFLGAGATLRCDQAIVGDIAAGQASVSGVDSRWDANTLTLGAVSADGMLQVLESGRVEVVGQLVVGDFSTAKLSLIDGGKAKAGQAVIGANVGSVGTIELDGDDGTQNSQLEVAGTLRVGVTGNGTLDIRKGSSVEANELRFASSGGGGSGQSRVIVAGSDVDGVVSDLTVFTDSRLGQGRFEVFNGARANFLNLTLGADGVTEVELSAFDLDGLNRAATLTTSRLTVGFDDFATLRVETGGQVTCTELAVNSLDTGGTGRIVVTGGNVTVNGTMRVSGDFQTGDNVIIEADGAIVANALRLGDQSTSDSAEIVVRNGTPGGGSSLLILNKDSNAECSIGKDGPGVLRLENRAVAGATGTARVGGSPSGGEGIVDIGADCKFVAGDLDVGGASPGTIKLLTGSSELIVVIGIAVVNAGGRIEGVGTFTGARIRNPGGFISPGLSPGTLTINGDYEQGEGGTLIIEVAGLGPGQFDVLKVAGNATLAGTVDLRFIDGFVPEPGDRVNFVQVDGAITGKLTGSTFIDAPGDPESGQPAAQAEIKWEVTPQGTCRMTVTDVTALDEYGLPLPAECGAGMCGTGVVSALPFTLAGLLTLRRSLARKHGRS